MRTALEGMSLVAGSTERVSQSFFLKSLAALVASFLACGMAQAQVDNTVGNFAGNSSGDWSGAGGAGSPVVGPPDNSCSNIGNVGSDNATFQYGFSIPGNATITDVNFYIKAAAGNTPEDLQAQLAFDASTTPISLANQIGTAQTIEIGAATPNCNSSFIQTFNFSLADWGTDSTEVTPAVVNDPNFGLNFVTLESSSIKVDSNCLEVEYTTPDGSATQIGCFTVQFTVNKDFSDDNPAEVEITLACNGADDITANPLMASEGNPAVFSVLDIDGGATCTATETSGLPAGYDKDESACQQANLPADGGECTILNTSNAPSMQVTKTITNTGSGPGGVFQAGDTIDYTIEATNDGNVTLTNVVVSDPLLGLTDVQCGTGTLAPTESCQVTGSYTVTQADIDNNGGSDGDIDNTATADSDESGPQQAAAEAQLVTQNASVSMTKTVTNTGTGAGGTFDAGDPINYTIELTNNGNVTLTSVVVSDPLLGLTDEQCGDGTLAPAATCQVTGSYTVTQGDIDDNGGGDGDIDNTATADNDQTGSQTASAEAPLAVVADMTTTKTVTNTGTGPLGTFQAGDTINYTIEATNDGTVTLDNVVVSDPLLGLTNESCAVTLEPQASCQVMGSYTVTQADIDDNGGGDGDIDNTATADSDTTGPESASAEAQLVGEDPSIAATKTVTNTGSGAGGNFDAGDTIEYTIEVTSDGNVTLDNVVVSDPLLGLTDEPCAATLAPGESCQVTGSYTVTQDDIDNNGGGDGDIDNTATANSDQAGPQTVNAAAQLATQDPDITIDKTADPATYEMVGEVITYTFLVTNTGNVTLFNITITDPLITDPPNSETINCPSGNPIPSLEAGASESCTATYTITEEDVLNGEVRNLATASADCTEAEGVPQPCSVDEDSETVDGEGVTTTFRVEKDFSDDNPAGVTVTVQCNTGLPLQQSAEIHDPDAAGLGPGDFTHVEFVVVNFEPGTMDCDIDEMIPAGYVPGYTAGVTNGGAETIIADEVGCHYEGITLGEFTCDIFNDLQPVDVVVEKQWIDENPEFQLPQVVEVILECSDPIVGGFQCFVLTGENGGNCSQRFIDPANPGEFEVLPHFDGTTCTATEEPLAGVVTDESDCEEMIVFPGQGDSCVIVNTRLFAGIPTLSQYALLLMALLMLGFGAVAYRRIV